MLKRLGDKSKITNILKNDPISKVRAKTALKSFACNYLDLGVDIRPESYHNITKPKR